MTNGVLADRLEHADPNKHENVNAKEKNYLTIHKDGMIIVRVRE